MPLITTKETAKLLGLAERTLITWRCTRAKYQPPYVQISPGCIRYDTDALNVWKMERTVTHG